MMVLQHLWTALPLVQWEDTFSFHVKLLQCFLLSFLDAHSDLAFVSQGPKCILAVLRQRLVNVGSHDPVFHRASPSGRHNNAIMRCPPRRRYDTSSLPSFVATSQEDQLMAVPLAFIPRLVNTIDSLYEAPVHSVASDLPGPGRVLLGGYDMSFTSVIVFLLWLLALAIILWRFSRIARARSTSVRTICRPPTVAADANLAKRVIQPPPQDGTQSPVAGVAGDVDHRLSMPGAWPRERCKQSAFETHPEFIFGVIPWSLIYLCTQKVWARFLGTASTVAASGPLDCILNSGVVSVGRTLEDGDLLVCQGPGSNKIDHTAGITTTAMFDGIIMNCSPSDFVLSIRNRRGSDAAMCDRLEPSSAGDPVIKDQVGSTILDAVREEKIGLALSLASTHTNGVLYREGISSDCDASTSGDRTECTKDEDLLNFGTRPPGIFPLERKDQLHALGRRQDGTLWGAGCPLSLRRARSTEYLWRKRDIFDDGDDSYWTEQVNARLSCTRPHRHGSSDISIWPREGRGDETDNWRIRNCSTMAEKESVNASLSDRVGGDDGLPGVYVVPQKRGWVAGDQCWSPVSSPQPINQPSGLGFSPFRKTPSLLTPEAWRPGCLYIPDPPPEELTQADEWWDSLSSVGGCRAGHMSDGGVIMPEQGAPVAASDMNFQGGQVSWRFSAIHRRAMTEG